MLSFVEWIEDNSFNIIEEVTGVSLFSFKEYLSHILEIDNVHQLSLEELLENLNQQDWETRLAAKEESERHIRRALKSIGFKIKRTSDRKDIDNGIDGRIGKDEVQFKSKDRPSNIFHAEAIIFHNTNATLLSELKNFDRNNKEIGRRGRDYKALAKWFYILDHSRTNLYRIPHATIKKLIDGSVKELQESSANGKLGRNAKYKASNGVELECKEDFEPRHMWKILANMPISENADRVYKVNPNSLPEEDNGFTNDANKMPTNIKMHPDMAQHGVELDTPASAVEEPTAAAQPSFLTNPKGPGDLIRKSVHDTGKGLFPIAQSKPNAPAKSKEEQLKTWTAFANKYGLKVSIQGDNFVFEQE